MLLFLSHRTGREQMSVLWGCLLDRTQKTWVYTDQPDIMTVTMLCGFPIYFKTTLTERGMDSTRSLEVYRHQDLSRGKFFSNSITVGGALHGHILKTLALCLVNPCFVSCK